MTFYFSKSIDCWGNGPWRLKSCLLIKKKKKLPLTYRHMNLPHHVFLIAWFIVFLGQGLLCQSPVLKLLKTLTKEAFILAFLVQILPTPTQYTKTMCRIISGKSYIDFWGLFVLEVNQDIELKVKTLEWKLHVNTDRTY